MTFAQRLKNERTRTGLTQEQTAHVLDQSKSIVEKWERGERTPTMITQEGALARLAKVKSKKP